MSAHPSMTSFAISLAVNLMIVGAFFATGIALTFRLVRPLSPRLRYIIAFIAFLAAAALPINSTLFGARDPVAAFPVAASVEPKRQPSTANAILNQSGETPVESSGEASVPAETSTLIEQPHSEPSSRIASLLNTFIRLLSESWPGAGFLYLWAFVAFVLLGREVLGYIHLARARRTWQVADAKIRDDLRWPDAYQLFISEHEGPYTVGLFQPAVVIPASLLEDLSPDEARLIARHELAHARWRDPLVNALVRIIRALLWPGLPLWFLGRAVRLEREAASDLSAVAASRDEDIKGAVMEYATLLVLVARLSGNRREKRWKYHWAATEAGNRIDLESRVLRLLTCSSRTTRARLLLAALALIATAWGALSLPAIARPVIVIPDSKLSDIVVVEEKKGSSSSAEQEQNAPAEVSQNVFPATQDENLRLTSDEQLTQNYLERETAESALTVQLDSVREQDQNIVGLPLTPLTSRAIKDEAERDFVNEIASFGYTKLSPEQLAAMKAHGVSAAYITEMAANGYNKLNADALINFRLLGVNSAYIREMTGLGYSALSANTMIDFRLYGVSSGYVRELAALGLSRLPAGKLVAFRRLGINAGYIKHVRSEISGNLSLDQLLALRNLGVTEGYLKELKARGVENLTADRVIDLRTQKVASGGTSIIKGDTQNE
jgi:beta-lactamase regulating signal transducer with metallopeptidase domain